MQQPKTYTELRMQYECYTWFHNSYPYERGYLYRIKNELDNYPAKKSESDRVRQLSENKSTGVIKGVSDLCYLSAYGPVFIELKIPGGVQSKEQKEWAEKVTRRGFRYFVVWSLQEFKDLMDTLVLDPPSTGITK